MNVLDEMASIAEATDFGALDRIVPGISLLRAQVATVEYQVIVRPPRIPARLVVAITFAANSSLDGIGQQLVAAGWTVTVTTPDVALRIAHPAVTTTNASFVIVEAPGIQLTVMHDGEWPAARGRSWLAQTAFAPLADMFDGVHEIAFASLADGRRVGRLQLDRSVDAQSSDDLQLIDRVLAAQGFELHDEARMIYRRGELYVEDCGGTIDAYLGGIPDDPGALPS